MARMMPSTVAKECRSPGERLLFERLRDDPNTSGWIILHSLGIAKHPCREYGEIDLVILAPGCGILCIEVKSGSVERRNGRWVYGGPNTTVSDVGPFRQAADSMHGLRKYITHHEKGMNGLLFYSAVVFTGSNVGFPEPIEWHSWQLLKRDDVLRAPISRAIRGVFQKAHEHMATIPSAKWYDATRSRPTKEQVEQIASLLRPDFEFPVDPTTTVSDAYDEMKRYTTDQFRVLDYTAECNRVIVHGPAGTGKTFLAVEAASRSMQRERRTLLACHNKLLGSWLKNSLQARCVVGPPHACGTLSSVLHPLSGFAKPVDGTSESDLTKYYQEQVPSAVIDRILSGAISCPMFDQLILDETQDLLTPPMLDALDLLLAGGLSGGRWMMFGDFERQAIYRGGITSRRGDGMELLHSRCDHFMSLPLRENCRNTRKIAAGLELLSGMNPRYSNVLCQIPGEQVSSRFYRSADEQVGLLEEVLSQHPPMFKPEEVVILSPRRADRSCGHALARSRSQLPITRLSSLPLQAGSCHYCSIHMFKGLEAPAVVVTDVDNLKGPLAESLLYVAMSRAHLRLTMLINEKCREAYMEMLDRGLAAAGQQEGGR